MSTTTENVTTEETEVIADTTEKTEAIAEVPEEKEVRKCSSCGNDLKDDDSFCSKCGAKEQNATPNFCQNCGYKLTKENMFCPKCGLKAGSAAPVAKKKKFPKVLIPVICVLLVVAIVLGVIIIRGKQVEKITLSETSVCLEPGGQVTLTCMVEPSDAKDKTITWESTDYGIATVTDGVITAHGEGYCTITATSSNKKIASCDVKVEITIESLLKEGNYEEAYTRSSDEDKVSVLDENLIACICAEAYPQLKNPESFTLRDAWIDKSKRKIVLHIGGTNSYGGTISSYWYYTFDDEYKLYTTVSDFDKEELYTWDDVDEMLEKVLTNAAKEEIKKIVYNDALKLDKDSIKNINYLFENDKLGEVIMLTENRGGANT